MQEFFLSSYAAVSVWVVSHLLKVIVIFIAAYVAQYFLGQVIGRVIRQLVRQGSQTKAAEVKRENTLIQVVSGGVYVVIWLIATMMILSEIGLAIGPLLAAAGIIGLAFGFGGQYLIRDLISGMFIIFISTI